MHPADREMLADPAKAPVDRPERQLFGGRLPYTEPDDVAELTDGAVLEPRRAGDHRRPRARPYRRVGAVPAAGRGHACEPSVCLSGDVLFAGSIGRTDLPGGSMARMLTSLRDKVLPLADDTVVLPGHGPATTIGRERAHQPVPARG